MLSALINLTSAGIILRSFEANCKKSEVNAMNASAVVLEGTIQPDGTLKVTQKVDLPAGPVRVMIQPVAELV
jgi:hypothetical protein